MFIIGTYLVSLVQIDLSKDTLIYFWSPDEVGEDVVGEVISCRVVVLGKCSYKYSVLEEVRKFKVLIHEKFHKWLFLVKYEHLLKETKVVIFVSPSLECFSIKKNLELFIRHLAKKRCKSSCILLFHCLFN